VHEGQDHESLGIMKVGGAVQSWWKVSPWGQSIEGDGPSQRRMSLEGVEEPEPQRTQIISESACEEVPVLEALLEALLEAEEEGEGGQGGQTLLLPLSLGLLDVVVVDVVVVDVVVDAMVVILLVLVLVLEVLFFARDFPRVLCGFMMIITS